MSSKPRPWKRASSHPEGRMRAFLAACLMTGVSVAAFAQNEAAALDRRIATCSTFTACFRLLDLDDDVARNHAADIARRLEQFGDSAKRQLLTRALARDRKITETVDAAD